MKRREWTFEKPASELVEAARERVNYHGERLDFWETEREKAESAINSAGFQVRSHAITGGERHEVVIDPTLAARLSECESKMAQHRARSDEYAQWYSALKTADARSFVLDHDDWLFFYGLRGDDDE
jgi:hypothetical protein